MMRSRTALLALFLCGALVISIPVGVSAQYEDAMIVESELSYTILSSIKGSGDVKLSFEGAPAIALRHSLFSPRFDTNLNQYLEPSEARNFLVAFSEALTGRQHWGAMIVSVTNFSEMSDTQLRAATSGIVNTDFESTEDISIHLKVSCEGESVTKLLRLSGVPLDTFVGALNTASGFVLDGTLVVKDRIMMFGLSGLTSPEILVGKLTEIRTPIGMILWYSFQGNVVPGSSPVEETLTYEPFSIYENLQLSFIMLLFGAVFILRVSGKQFSEYVMKHPKRFRESAKRLPVVRWFTWGLVALLSLIYVLPFIFSFIDRGVMISSYFIYILAPGFVVLSHFISKSLYNRASFQIPDDMVIPIKQALVKQDDGSGQLRCEMCMRLIDADKELYECVCGYKMHMDCAERAQMCPQCGEVLFPEHTRSIQCKSCEETFLSSGEEDPYTLQCTRCGAFQEEVQAGRNYLVVDIDSKRAYNMIRAMGLSGRPAMVMTSEFPGKVREQYDLGDDFDVKCLCDSTTDIDSINIHDLDGDAMENVSTFLMTTKHSGLLIEGLDALISKNDFGAALAFIKRVNDLAAIHGAAVIMPIRKESLSEDEFKTVSDEFDEVHDYL